MSGIDSLTFRIKSDSAWSALKDLDIADEFATYPYRIGIYLYTPGEAVVTPPSFSNTVDAKWIVFLYYDSSTISGITNTKENPSQYRLMQNYPNPFNPSTIIEYQLSKSEVVTLRIYDILGREVKTLLSEQLENAGIHKAGFIGDELSSGIYFYKLTVNGNTAPLINKMVLLR